MPEKKWFMAEPAHAIDVAAITDDLRVELDDAGTVTIFGWEGGHVHLDFDDTVDMAAVLAKAAKILRARGYKTAELPSGTRDKNRR